LKQVTSTHPLTGFVLDSSVDPATNDVLSITSLYYSFPVGDFTIAVGPLFDQDDLVPTTTSTYSNSFMLSGWNIGPNAIALLGFTGAGAGIAYTSDNGWNAGFNFVSTDGNDSAKGIGTDESDDTVTFMAGYDGSNFGGGIIYAEIDNPNAAVSTVANYSVPTTYDEDPSVFGVGAYWQITDNADISVGMDFLDIGIAGYDEGSQLSIGIDYAIGAGTLSAGLGTIPHWDLQNNFYSIGTAYEVYYEYPVADGITIKPGFFFTNLEEWASGTESTAVAVEATFSF
jgi:predicted porin